MQVEEGAVVFVGLYHHVVARAVDMDIGVEILGYAAKERAASEFGLTQYMGDEGGGGGFAMGTGNGDAAFALRELSEELGTLHDGYAFLE